MGDIPLVDISGLLRDCGRNERELAAKEFAYSIKAHGCAAIVGHGISEESLRDVFITIRKVFSLPAQEKAKAKHPPTLLPHRGYLGTSIERSGQLSAGPSKSHSERAPLRNALDLKESFDFGHEENKVQENIWLPDDVFPGFRESMIALFSRLNRLSLAILEGLMYGMDLSEPDRENLRHIHSPIHHQMRLAHYLSLTPEDRQNPDTIRLAPHTDFSSYTLLFQESAGGLEFQNRDTGRYMSATPQDGVMYLNIGDLMERYSNGFYPAAMHRVAIPPMADAAATIPSRYSVPYFTHIALEQSIFPMPSRIKADGESRYEPIESQALMNKLFKPVVGKKEA